MGSVLILGNTGSGKTTSIFPNEKLGIIGLPPKSTFIIAATEKAIPMKNWKEYYTLTTTPKEGNFMRLRDISLIGKALDIIAERQDIEDVILDDVQFWMGDYYMQNSEKGDNFTVFKKIGLYMYNLMTGLNRCQQNGKNTYILMHYETVEENGRFRLKPKTAGKMVENYLTLEGKYDANLFAKVTLDITTKTYVRQFVTNADGEYNEARSLPDLFDNTYIPNDLGIIKTKMKEYGI